MSMSTTNRHAAGVFLNRHVCVRAHFVFDYVLITLSADNPATLQPFRQYACPAFMCASCVTTSHLRDMNGAPFL